MLLLLPSLIYSRFQTITLWTSINQQPSPPLISLILPHLSIGCKTPKGRQATLVWLRNVATVADGKSLDAVLDDILDGVLDKAKETRSAATDLLEIVVGKGCRQMVLAQIARRRPTDASHLRAMVEALTGPEHSTLNQSPSLPEQPVSEDQPAMDVRKTTSSATAAASAASVTAANRAALANRRNALVLGKPKLGADGKPLPKYNAKSSIPKPIPLPRPSKTPLFRVPEKSGREREERGTTSGLFIGEGGREVPSLEEPVALQAPAYPPAPMQSRPVGPVGPVGHARADSFVSFSEVENQEPFNGIPFDYQSSSSRGVGGGEGRGGRIGEVTAGYREDSTYRQSVRAATDQDDDDRRRHHYHHYHHRQLDELSLNSNEPRDGRRMIENENNNKDEDEEESEGLGPLPHFPFAGSDNEEDEDGNGFGMFD